MATNNGFVVPKETLERLNEFSGGGFILFIYDENQNPRPYAKFDTMAHGLGMQRFLENWVEAVHNINVDNTTQALMGMTQNEEEEPPASGDWKSNSED